jgi:hypothetical protein
LQACCNDDADYSQFSDKFIVSLIKDHKQAKQAIKKLFIKDFADALINLKKMHHDFGAREDIFGDLHAQIKALDSAIKEGSFNSQANTQEEGQELDDELVRLTWGTKRKFGQISSTNSKQEDRFNSSSSADEPILEEESSNQIQSSSGLKRTKSITPQSYKKLFGPDKDQDVSRQ